MRPARQYSLSRYEERLPSTQLACENYWSRLPDYIPYKLWTTVKPVQVCGQYNNLQQERGLPSCSLMLHSHPLVRVGNLTVYDGVSSGIHRPHHPAHCMATEKNIIILYKHHINSSTLLVSERSRVVQLLAHVLRYIHAVPIIIATR